ncbi:unnamed protein product [Cyprideis torosa]|uniref:Uncharacterized protein n=1 Tax=Cyprideis torosa TaxID=163714 RepID=A0A7R8ZVC2_9CRUS|nr:unnamed protein product [Cyprideis torosa]CAG0902830.1 unnamed protein product [Cyprideis torosa]
MDIHELFLSCRRGDLGRVKYLVEQKEVELNVRDKWDSTPLYYACLCGHLDLVKYLLENGARCEANTFDGERCLYGALNNDIRNILRSYHAVSTHTMRREDFGEFLRILHVNGELSDLKFIVNGHEFLVHGCILAARSSYFCDQLLGRWAGRKTIVTNNPLIRPDAFRAMLQFLYTARMEGPVEIVEDCLRLALQIGRPELKKYLTDAVRKITSFECTKPGTNVKTFLVEPPEAQEELTQDLGIMAEQAMPCELTRWVGGEHLPLMPRVPLQFVDVVFQVDGHRFFCHQVFFVCRSEYFRGLLANHFEEFQRDSELNCPIVPLKEVSCDVFTAILHYLYTNQPQLDGSIVLEVLEAAEMFLLSGLKRQCGTFLATQLTLGNSVDIYRLSRTFQLPRLEDQCCEFFANNIEHMVERSDFRDIVKETAQEVHGREETDTIPVIDDIRYHINGEIQTMSELEEAERRLRIIDALLEDLELDA